MATMGVLHRHVDAATRDTWMRAWQDRCVAVAMRLGRDDVVVSADEADGVLRITYATTGLPWRGALTAEDRERVRERLADALDDQAERALKRKAG